MTTEDLAWSYEFFFRGTIVMQVSIVMLIRLLISDKLLREAKVFVGWGQTATGDYPLSLLQKNASLIVMALLSVACWEYS